MRRGVHWDNGWRQRRAQSNVIAVVLLVALVIAGATVVVVAGTEALDQGQGDAASTAALQSMQSFDAKVDGMAQGSSSQANVEFPDQSEGVQLVSESPANPVEAGKVSITVDLPSGTTTNEEFWLGTLKSERDGETVAYQGGGVWRKTGNGSVAVSSPAISYRSAGSPGTATFPIVTVEGSGTGSDFRVDSVERTRLLSTLGLSNPVDPGTTITVEFRSEFYQAWATELRSEFGSGAVTTDHDMKTATVTLKSPTSANAPSAVLGTNVNGGLWIKNFGATDSYDSESGAYPGYPNNNNADVLTKGAIDPSNKMSVRGDLVVENGLDGDTVLSTKVEIFGRTVFGDDPDIGSGDYLTLKGSDQTFHGTFSTKDNLRITKQSKFNGDVLVDGDFKADKSKRPEIGGRLVVTGDVEEIGTADIGGPVYVHGDASNIASKGTVNIDGDLVVYGDIEVGADTDVDGTIYYRDGASVNIDSNADYDSKQKLSTSEMNTKLASGPMPITPDVPTRSSAKTEINSWSSLSTASNNDNGGEDTIDSSDELELGGPSDDTIGSGKYYLDGLDVASGETLTLDTSGGDVVIYVPDTPGETALDIDGTIEVTGSNPDHRVRIYVDDASAGDADSELTVGGTGEVTVPADKSPNMWVYFKPTADITLDNHALYQGVMYGASDAATGGAEIEVSNHAQVHGSLIGDVTDLPNHATLHYDEALESKKAFTTPSTVAPVDFVHFSRRRATVDE